MNDAFWFYNFQITDLPPNLFYCHELRELDICDNELKEIPAAIESLTRLVKLNVNRNGKPCSLVLSPKSPNFLLHTIIIPKKELSRKK